MAALRYLRYQIDEISKDVSLVLYGAFLCLTHVLTFMFWNNRAVINLLAGAGRIESCWPIFPNCAAVKLPSSMAASAMLWIYLVIAIIGILLFIFRKVSAGYLILLSLTLFKLLVVLKSYTFMGNYHYMALWVSVAYLFIPDKVKTLFYLIISFYMGAGLIKFNYEWLSGASLLKPAIWSGWLLGLSLLYVVLFEMCFCWGLVVKRRWIFWLTLVQVFAFHAFSWHIVGFYYPCIMTCVTSIYWLKALQKDYWDDDYFLLSLPKIRSAFIFLIVFWICQIVPKVIRANPAVDGIMRIPSLNMLDARTECQINLFEEIDDRTRMDGFHFNRSNAVRTKCDPLVYLSQVYYSCKRDPDQILHLSLMSRLSTDDRFSKVLEIHDACHKKYNLLWAEIFEVAP